MFMSASIEGRPPFLSKKLVEKRFSLSDDDIHSESIGKKNIKEIAARYFDSEFVYRPKIGFSSPYGDWLADENIWGKYLRDLNFDLFSDILNVDILRNIIDNEDPYKKFTGNNLNVLMLLTSFQAFYSIYFENAYQNNSIDIPNL
jgi:asparagine synthase (glutamine-hydrolysing)